MKLTLLLALTALVVVTAARPKVNVAERQLMKRILTLLEDNVDNKRSSHHKGKRDEVSFFGEKLETMHAKSNRINKRVVLIQKCLDEIEPAMNAIYSLAKYAIVGEGDESLVDAGCSAFEGIHLNMTIISEHCDWVPSQDDWDAWEVTPSPAQVQAQEEVRVRTVTLANYFEPFMAYACEEDGRKTMKAMRESKCVGSGKIREIQIGCDEKKVLEKETTCEEQNEIEQCVKSQAATDCGEAYGEFYNNVYRYMIEAHAAIAKRDCPVELDSDELKELNDSEDFDRREVDAEELAELDPELKRWVLDN